VKLLVLTDGELSALAGESPDVFKFYVMLRARMDFATGLVGAEKGAGVSWQGLREDMYVEPRAGRQTHGTPSEKYVRDKAARLAELGLLESRTSYRRLVFFMPLAHVAESRSNLMGQTWGRQAGQEAGQTASHEQQGFQRVMGQEAGQVANGLMGHTSGIRLTPISVVNEIPPPRTEPVDNSGAASVAAVVGGFVELIRKGERGRNCLCRVRDTDALVIGWARDGVTLTEVQDAYRQAAWERERRNDPSPINAPFLDTIIRRERNGRGVSRKEDAGPATDARKLVWYMTAEGIERRAQALGVARQDGETIEALKLRCFEAESQAARHGKRR